MSKIKATLSVNELITKVRRADIKSILSNVFAASGNFQLLSEKDASNGYVGLTLFKINFKNVLNTFTSFFTNSNTVSRTYTFQDRTGTIADLFVQNTRTTTNNRYFSGMPSTATPTTGAVAANSLKAVGIIVKNIITVDTIACEVTTGTSGNIRIGIYADDGTGQPGALIVDSGNLVISAPAVLTATINVTLSPGIYWFAYLADTANTLRGYASNTYYNILGLPSTFGVNNFNGCQVIKTFGALPNPFTAGFTYNVLTPFPIIALRII